MEIASMIAAGLWIVFINDILLYFFNFKYTGIGLRKYHVPRVAFDAILCNPLNRTFIFHFISNVIDDCRL